MPDPSITLCAPDERKSCFACCPPIRPTGYEHIQYRSFIRRELLRSTREYRSEDREIRPITGFSCWALGFLNSDYTLIGCLLHPLRNQGRDLRHRVGYGQKCARETCEESKFFQELHPSVRRSLMSLADGLDSFSYSSRMTNPLFSLLWWGPQILTHITERRPGISRKSFFKRFKIFSMNGNALVHSYAVTRIVVNNGIDFLENESAIMSYKEFSRNLLNHFSKLNFHQCNRPYTHKLALDPRFSSILETRPRNYAYQPYGSSQPESTGRYKIGSFLRDFIPHPMISG